MATSGTHTFNLDLSDIMEEAYDIAGAELRSGYSFMGATRALNLVFFSFSQSFFENMFVSLIFKMKIFHLKILA